MTPEEVHAFGLQFSGTAEMLSKIYAKMELSGVFNPDLDDLNTCIDILHQLASDMPDRALMIKEWQNIPDDNSKDY